MPKDFPSEWRPKMVKVEIEAVRLPESIAAKIKIFEDGVLVQHLIAKVKPPVTTEALPAIAVQFIECNGTYPPQGEHKGLRLVR